MKEFLSNPQPLDPEDPAQLDVPPEKRRKGFAYLCLRGQEASSCLLGVRTQTAQRIELLEWHRIKHGKRQKTIHYSRTMLCKIYTADSVGRRLAMLAKYGQIIVITHSPQVAAHGDHQWKVEKIQTKNTLPLTKITELKHQDRLIEIARMLAGKEISAEALAAAEKLLVKA